jgi:DNA-binding transcriptional MerR regulator
MRIGDFARLANVSVRAVRFYDHTGLLRAAGVDAETGYRQYHPQQITRLRQIRAFQELGFSLHEIRELLRADLPAAEARTRIEERKFQIKRQLRADLSRLERIERHLRDWPSCASLHSRITLQEAGEAWVVSLRARLRSYDQAEEMFQELERKIPEHLLTANRTAFWHSCESSGGTIDCEALRYVKRPLSPPLGLKVYQLPATTVASLFHCGGDASISESYGQMNRWLASSNLQLRGAKREVYWVERDFKNREQSVTEIQFPVARVSARRHRAA